ncbi:CDP-glycerol glycerophosphotransferase family protein [Demequina sp. NBRC 110057]|uniref:CDP-glycerol glycerophosphotransferase family protein n=1 Tax=Demequina sp. NBRC 110057 TaxID=1570346 RepID=UPI0009FD706A|nr:CDP-glycerol glycerophosphotransferase family protein [Demequina sp. NBRC 110057]
MLSAVRRVGGVVIRRLGLLPGGVADGLGEDDSLAGRVLASRVAVFFPDPPENLYQLRQWYGALDALDAEMGVTVVTQDSRTARAVREETGLDVVVAARTRTVDALLRDGEVRVVLYVGHAHTNAVALRSIEVAHVFLAHGDSDKAVSVSNQVKGFDVTLVAGQAAIDRYRASMLFFDADARLRVIGRPQLPEGSHRSGTTVMYAPTWEGSQAANAYSSVVSHGEAIVASLLAGGWQVRYRPHPRLGKSDARFREADARIRAAIEAGGGTVDLTPDAGAAMREADVLITDVSAMSTDWLSQRRPLIVAEPTDPRALPTTGSLLHSSVPRLAADAADEAAALVTATVGDPAHRPLLDRLAAHYLGGMSGEESLAAFITTCARIAAERDEAVRVRESGHAHP